MGKNRGPVGPFQFLGGCMVTVCIALATAAFLSDSLAKFILMMTVTVLVGVLYFRTNNVKYERSRKKQYSFLYEEEGFEQYLMQLVSCVIKVDKKATDSEFNYVQAALVKHFESEKVSRMMAWLRKSIGRDIDYKAACGAVAYGFSVSSKMQLMHLLVGVVTADGFLSNKEYELVKDMAKRMRIPFRTFQQVVAMFRFRREGERAQKKQSYSSGRSRSKTSLSQAYSIIGVDSKISDKALKKAYRKLAVLHHPDKVAHMGADFQKAAKEKFQQIQEAYEIIKKSRGMN